MESFLDGQPFIDWARQLPPSASELREQLCNEGIDAFCKMLFIDNFVHGDLHPGTIFVVPQADGGQPQVAFLDAGISVHASQPLPRGSGRSLPVHAHACSQAPRLQTFF